MDEKHIRLVLGKLNNIIEQGVELPLYWQYEKDGGRLNNIDEDKALIFLSHIGIVKLGHVQAILNTPVYTSKDGALSIKSQPFEVDLPARKILENGVDYEKLQKALMKYGLVEDEKKKTMVKLRLSSDGEEAYIVMGGKKYRIDTYAKAYGTKKRVFIKAYNSDGTRINIADFDEDYLKGYNHNFQQVFRQGIFTREPLCWFMDIGIRAMRVQRIIAIDKEQYEWIKRNLSEQYDD